MTSELELGNRFADLAALEPSPNFKQLGKLTSLADWLISTGLSVEDWRPAQRELIVFSPNQPKESPQESLPELAGVKISHHWPASSDWPASSGDTSVLDALDVLDSIEIGIQIADRAIDSGTTLLFLTSDQDGIRHDLEILIGALTRTDAASVAARQDISDQVWMENVTGIRDGIFAVRDRVADPVALLAHTQSLDLASMLGVILQSAKRATPLVLIGDAAHCAALIAQRISHRSREWLIPAVDLTSPAGALAQRHLDRQPILELAIPFGLDYLTPVSMTAPIIDAILRLVRSPFLTT